MLLVAGRAWDRGMIESVSAAANDVYLMVMI